ncbi:hypothetical protein E2I00_005389 [Balaenoptera physalus]|uniref:Charged multivesicular body protein 2B n=1 Tax=Balaenoptera physalus TaxID=9770 RepID=A0A6A1Q1Y2_BALPH|nr:hypothetical protein E2I00_005389 [Balaenoptera physalus]
MIRHTGTLQTGERAAAEVRAALQLQAPHRGPDRAEPGCPGAVPDHGVPLQEENRGCLEPYYFWASKPETCVEELEIKKMAKIGNKEACRVLAKQLVHLRKQKTRTFAVSSKVTSMSTQTKVMNSQMKMAGAMSTTAKTMQAVNKKMDPQKTLQTMQNFQKENMKMEMTEEMINDTLDDIFEGSDDEEESQDIVNQVLDEIGIEISGKMAKAPSAARSLPSASTSKATISDEEIERQLKALGVD